MNIYVFGASGYVGKNLVMDIESYTTVGRDKCDIVFDLHKNDPNELIKKIKENSYFIFLAGISSLDHCENNKVEATKINYINTLKIIQGLSQKNCRILFSSTDAVFGAEEKKAFEYTNLNPKGHYAFLKAAVEKEISQISGVKIIRFSYIFGKGDKFTELIREFSNRNEVLEVYSGFKRNVVCINDVVEGIVSIIRHWDKIDARTFNFSGPDLVSREKIASLFSKNEIKGFKYNVQNPDESFWYLRAESIETDNYNFSKLLSNKPKNIKDMINEWR